jgi:hypothetical protein
MHQTGTRSQRQPANRESGKSERCGQGPRRGRDSLLNRPRRSSNQGERPPALRVSASTRSHSVPGSATTEVSLATSAIPSVWPDTRPVSYSGRSRCVPGSHRLPRPPHRCGPGRSGPQEMATTRSAHHRARCDQPVGPARFHLVVTIDAVVLDTPICEPPWSGIWPPVQPDPRGRLGWRTPRRRAGLNGPS